MDRSDLAFAAPDGSDFALSWEKGGGACLSIGGDQPMDQPPCSISLTRDQLVRLIAHLAIGVIEASGTYTPRDIISGQLGEFIPELSEAIAREAEELL